MEFENLPKKTAAAESGASFNVYVPSTINLVDLADKDYPTWVDFADVYCHQGYYRFLFPGPRISSYIRQFRTYAENSLDPLVKEKAAIILEKYKALYKRCTTHPYDDTAPTEIGVLADYEASIAHFKKDQL